MGFPSRRAAPGSGGSQAAAPGSDVSSDGSLSPAVPQALSFSPEKREAPVSESVATELALDAARPPEEAAPREVKETDSLSWGPRACLASAGPSLYV